MAYTLAQEDNMPCSAKCIIFALGVLLIHILSHSSALSTLNSSVIDSVMLLCEATGCIQTQRRARPPHFIHCNTVTIEVARRLKSHCRDGYSSDINENDFDFIYDFNSIYAYDSSVYESLAWQAPERMQFLEHALRHKPSRVAINLPISQQKWSSGLIWALKELGVHVTEYLYDNSRINIYIMMNSILRWTAGVPEGP